MLRGFQAQALNLLRRLQGEPALTPVFISHDFGAVQHPCDEVAVMYQGRILERAPTAVLFAQARYPYTWSLTAAVLPRPGPAPPLGRGTGAPLCLRGGAIGAAVYSRPVRAAVSGGRSCRSAC